MNNFEKPREQVNLQQAGQRRGRNALAGMSEHDKREKRVGDLNRRVQARESAAKFARTVGALALTAIVAVGVAIGSGEATNGIMNTERVSDANKIQVESIMIYGGPNLRGDPYVTDRYDPPNVIMDLGDGGQKMLVPYRGDAYYYNNKYDANGGWYGFPAEDFANELYKNSFVGKEGAKKIIKREKNNDGWVWISDNYVKVVELSLED